MSVQQNTYLIYGVMFAFDLFTEEALDSLEPFRDNAFKPARPFEELTALIDGMNGEYVILGFVKARSDDGEGIELTKLPSVAETEAFEVEAVQKLWDACPIPEQQSALGWYVLTHYR